MTDTATAPAAPAADTTLLNAAKGNPSGGDAQKTDGGTPDTKPNGQPAAPAKPDGGAPDPSKPADANKPNDTPQGAPEKYADFTLPEGIKLDPTTAEQFKIVAKELGLPQAKAQKLVDLQANLALKTHQDALAAQEALFKQTQETWKAETLKAFGAQQETEMAFVAKARDQFASPELRKLLDDTGMGNHPEVMKMFAKLGKAVAEDRFADGKGTKLATSKNPAEVLFGNSK